MRLSESLKSFLVVDIETYRPDHGKFKDRRIELDPDRNYITVIGIYDGKQPQFSPITSIGQNDEEQKAIKWFSEKIENIECVVGFNLLGFDIPYLVHKGAKYGVNIDFSNKKIIDLYWFIPAWLDNTSDGSQILEHYDVGKIWSLNSAEQHILHKPKNDISHDQYFQFYEQQQYNKIIEKLKTDLISSYELLMSKEMDDVSAWIESTSINHEHCSKTCPFRRIIPMSSDKSKAFCPLVSKMVSNEMNLKPIESIVHPKPWDASFKALCIEK